MRSLWEMEGGNSDQRLKKWHEILMESAELDRRRKEKTKREVRKNADLWVHEVPDSNKFR